MAFTESVFRMMESLRGVRLLRTGNIRKAFEINQPEELADGILQKMFDFGFAYCEANSQILLVAYTQFPADLLENFGLDSHQSRMIYVSHRHNNLHPRVSSTIYSHAGDTSIQGMLLINPEIIEDEMMGRHIMVERCGSIYLDSGEMPHMFMQRPEWVSVKGYIYHPGKTERQTKAINGRVSTWFAGYLEHEWHHLEGFDATYFPKWLVDPWGIPAYHKVYNYSGYIEAHVKEIGRQDGIILVARNGQIEIVDAQGKFLQIYRQEI